MNIVEYLNRKKPELLSAEFYPSPLWISCCNWKPNVIRFLMEKMTPKQIAKPGPDGTTPLMQLFANIKKKKEYSTLIEQIIIHFALADPKFLPQDILEASITFGNAAIFEKVFQLSVSSSDAMNLARMAVQSEDTKILEIIIKNHPELESSCQELGGKCQTRQMLKLLENSCSYESELIKMSRKFPKFNENLEKAIKPLPQLASEVDIERDIKPLLKEKFCGIVDCYGKDPTAVPISKWQIKEKKSCHGNHVNG